MIRLNFREDQIPIMNYSGGTMAVPAVPGAGKTFIVAHLASKIIEEKRQKPGKVLIVTYMNSAVNNFKSRISSVLNEKGINSNNDYEVMTIHSLAMKILKERPDIVGVNEDFKILDDVKKILYLNSSIEDWRIRGGERVFRTLLSDYGNKKYGEKNGDWWKNFFSIVDILISELKLNNITPEKLKENQYILGDNSIIPLINYIYASYVNNLKREGYVDYNDLIVLAYKALNIDENLRLKFQKRYSFVFEDECQDSNSIQCKILALISENNGNLVRVGDLNQSIMGTFTASDPKFFDDFCTSADKKHVMSMAGRSTKEIIELANYFVDYTLNNHPEINCRTALKEQKIEAIVNMDSFKNPEIAEYGIQGYCMSSWERAKESTIKAVVNFKAKHPDKTIGILVPFNSHTSEIVRSLKRDHIDCDELSNTSEKRLRVTNILGNILNFMGEPDNIYKFKNLIDIIIEENITEKNILISNIAKYKVIDILEKNIFDKDLIDEIKYLNKDLLRLFIKKCNNIKEILNYPYTSLEDLILYIGNMMDFTVEDKAMVQAVASYVRHELKDNNSLTLEQISLQLLDTKNTTFKHISDVIYDLQGYELVPERVTVSTYHKSKGLEWDCVFLLYLNDYVYPSSIKGKFRSEYYYFKEEFKNPIALGKAEIQKILGNNVDNDPFLQGRIDVVNEKIRLLYVAITRAKRYLIFMSHYDKEKNDSPSKYFDVLKEFVKKRAGEYNA